VSYQVLARKWRPRNFQEVVGQQHVLTALSNGLAQNRVHHAYLFSGTRGVGKTTIARILAKCLNCEQGVTATPCGKCVHCQAIDQGRFVDLLEIDAASRTKVDDTRELLDNVQYKPAQGRYKVYLIDEVHMLSKSSFNALLKTLEEPPEYVKFLLATTDPQKLPITVLSRCLQFHLKAILPEEIEKQLNLILQHEQATFDKAALTVIAKAANGSIRDALSLTDQALAFGAGHIEYQAVLKMLGTLDNSHLYYLMHFIAAGNVQKVFEKIEEFVHLGADFAKLHQDLAALCHHIALLQIQNKANASEKSTIELLAERLTPEEVQLYYQIALQGYKDYAFAPNGKIAFEMTVMRLLAFKPANYISLDDKLLDNVSSELQNVVAPVEASEPVDVKPSIDFRPPQTQEVLSSPAMDENRTAERIIAKTPVEQPAPVIASKEDVVASVSEVEVVTPEPKAPIESAQPVTHSRNMLRSHRLKREQEKKLQATTVNKELKAVVAEEETVNSNPIATQVNHPQPAIQIEPLATAIDAHPIITEEPVPPSQQLPPIDSYLQDNFSESEQYEVQHEPVPQVSSYTVADNRPSLTTADTVNLDAGKELTEETFFSREFLEVPSVDIAHYVADKLTDPWSLVIQQMQLMGLVKLLAKNSVMKQVDQQIILTLKSEQQHLLNNGKICEQLQEKLKAHYGQQVSMYIEIGSVPGQVTPNESELQIYQQYLDAAKNNIKQDENIRTWVQDYDAKIYENSIIPL